MNKKIDINKKPFKIKIVSGVEAFDPIARD
jgi:hypothetical protein